MFLQTLTAKRVKTRDSFGFGVGIETNRASNLPLKVLQKRLHRDRQTLKDSCETHHSFKILFQISEKTEQSPLQLTACGQSRSMTFFVTLDCLSVACNESSIVVWNFIFRQYWSAFDQC